MAAVTRDDAIARLAMSELATLSPAERAEQLKIMTLEDWSAFPGWNALRLDVRREMECGELRHDASSARYDGALLLWLDARHRGSTNAYLRECLHAVEVDVDTVVGQEPSLLSCPCCGRASLSARGCYQICAVCWWEDDGQDNEDADLVLGGPNRGLSLTQARVNFLVHGISDLDRDDLRAHQVPPAKYARGREFALSANREEIAESGSNWTSTVFHL
jgi:hypothetical protein